MLNNGKEIAASFLHMMFWHFCCYSMLTIKMAEKVTKMWAEIGPHSKNPGN